MLNVLDEFTHECLAIRVAGLRVELVLYAGSNLDKARRIFERASLAYRPPAHAGAGTSGRGMKHCIRAAPDRNTRCHDQLARAAA
jgi:hypothetical protein